MRRLFIVACVLSAVIGSAHAQQGRERLEGFGGVRFGMDLGEAKRILGAGVEEAEVSMKDGRKIRTLVKNDLVHAGESHTATFSFGTNQRLSKVTIAPKEVFGKTNSAACLSGGKLRQALEQQYGRAEDGKRNEKDLREYFFRFKDGNEIHIYAIFSGACITFTGFYTPQGKDD